MQNWGEKGLTEPQGGLEDCQGAKNGSSRVGVGVGYRNNTALGLWQVTGLSQPQVYAMNTYKQSLDWVNPF